ncbi:hypothetical protein FCV36_05425 [Clostridium sporogenes]|uniref:hypothetical protein n=1 Tax=Clostridium sporogenes TaxID=1509 RepID=UPI0013CFB97D|nr:hypothetical protein [Clostridium sporogenes]NFG01780.1 hypothetical protein [Clostridium sporogenes]
MEKYLVIGFANEQKDIIKSHPIINENGIEFNTCITVDTDFFKTKVQNKESYNEVYFIIKKYNNKNCFIEITQDNLEEILDTLPIK